MKPDRLSALRQRLKRGSFEFGALLEGVSTLDDDSRRSAEENRAPSLEPTAKQNGGHAAATALFERQTETEAAPATERAAGADPAFRNVCAEETQPQPSIFDQQERGRSKSAGQDAEPDRLRAALDSLGCRFLQEMGSLRAALAGRDIEQGGFHLAHVNQLLELLRDIDPDGNISRKLGSMAAPPAGRCWPTSCWTVVEFAGSPLSGLLPPKADEVFTRDLLYAAWGVTFASRE